MRLTGHTLLRSVLLASIAFLPSKSFCQSKSESFVLATTKVTGLQEFDETRVIATSGLHNGQSVKLQDLETAAQKLAQSGFFQRVSFSYSYDQDKMNVEFKVAEAKDLLPCILITSFGSALTIWCKQWAGGSHCLKEQCHNQGRPYKTRHRHCRTCLFPGKSRVR